MLYNRCLIVFQIVVILLVQSGFASTVAAQCKSVDAITSMPGVEQEDPDMTGEPGTPRRTQSSGTR